jgi:uncharacterized protein
MQAWLVSTMLLAATPTPVAPQVEGSWSGALQAGGASLRLVLHVSQRPRGGLMARLDSLDQGALGLPVEEVSLRDRTLSLRMKALGASYTGIVSNDGNEIKGEWIQGGAFPLVFRRGGPAAARRPQEPKGSVPYREEEVSIESGGAHLAGTLTVPRGKGPFPGVVLITGSGPQDRNESLAGHRPFLVLADHLTRQGLAVLRYDDRGFGKSSGRFHTATTADFADDAQKALAFLRARPEVDPSRAGLLGHSEGAMVAALVASRSTDAAFAVLLAETGVNGEQVLVEQIAQVARVSGMDAAFAAQQRALQQAIFAVIKGENDPAAARRKLEEVLAPALAQVPEAQRGAALKGQIDDALSPWMRSFLTYDPLPALRAVKCPVLALFGGKDLQVTPAQNAGPVEAALKEGGHADQSVRVLPGLNHLFQTAGTGSPTEYAAIEETMAPAALTAVSEWIVARTTAPPPPK